MSISQLSKLSSDGKISGFSSAIFYLFVSSSSTHVILYTVSPIPFTYSANNNPFQVSLELQLLFGISLWHRNWRTRESPGWVPANVISGVQHWCVWPWSYSWYQKLLTVASHQQSKTTQTHHHSLYLCRNQWAGNMHEYLGVHKTRALLQNA